MEKIYHFIYKTTNIINNKYYIGMHSTNNLEDGYIGSGKILRNSIKKYGKENFRINILEFLSNRKSLIDKEIETVNDSLLIDENCMNIKNGGNGGFSLEQTKNGRKITDDFLKNKYGDNFRSIIIKKYHESLSDDEKLIRSNKIKEGQIKIEFNHATFNKNHTSESIEKMKLTHQLNGDQKGEKNSQFGKCWIYNVDTNENKKILKNEIDKWINDKWIKGRKMK